MQTITQPSGFSISDHFPNARQVRSWEGGCAYLAEQDGVYYVIVDEGTLVDFLGADDRDLLDQLIKVIAFESNAERDQYVLTRWGGSAV